MASGLAFLGTAEGLNGTVFLLGLSTPVGRRNGGLESFAGRTDGLVTEGRAATLLFPLGSTDARDTVGLAETELNGLSFCNIDGLIADGFDATEPLLAGTGGGGLTGRSPSDGGDGGFLSPGYDGGGFSSGTFVMSWNSILLL